MGLSTSPTPPPHSSGSPNKSFNSKEITFPEVGILLGCMCGPKLPLWARIWVRRMQAKERRPAGSGQVGNCIITHLELSFAGCSPTPAPLTPSSPTTTAASLRFATFPFFIST